MEKAKAQRVLDCSSPDDMDVRLWKTTRLFHLGVGSSNVFNRAEIQVAGHRSEVGAFVGSQGWKSDIHSAVHL